ncbi:MAG: 4Fe-4S binding protein [Candidatus Omnitrophota bacterium]|nr:4Fe-4S binding protein [Candidatus Omnitrophota bacterium]
MNIEQLKWKMVERPLIPIQDSWVDATPFIALILLLGASIFIIFKLRKKQLARHIVQLSSLILFAFTFHRCFCAIRGWFFGLSEIGRDNLSVFQNTCIFIPIIASLFIFGRIFCGWICPLGFIQESIRNIFRHVHHRVGAIIDRPLLFFFIAITIFLIYRFKPVNFFVIQNMASIFGLLLLVICFFSIANPANDLRLKKSKYFFLVIWVLSILLGIFVTSPWCAIYGNELDYSSLIGFISVLFAGLIVSMAWCRYMCPLGGLFALLAKFYNYTAKGSGIPSKEYKNTCPMGAITKNGTVDKENCIYCFRCIEKHGFKISS